jgi:putative nucleotidyltransferase-like protein
MPPELSAEHGLLLACIRRALGAETTAAALDASSASQIDWSAFEAAVGAEGLAPLAHLALATSQDLVPAPLLKRLRAASAVAAFRSKTRFEPTLTLALESLATAGLAPVVLKGAALAFVAYPKSTYRTLADIDLLVAPEDLAVAEHALLSHGFRQLGALPPHGHHHLPPLVAPAGDFLVELHEHLMPKGNPYGLDLAAMCGRAELRMLGRQQARVFAPADNLLHVCLHLTFGHRYEWFPLRGLADILALTQGGLDWELFAATAQAARLQGAVYWPLRLAERWLGAPVPVWVLDRLSPSATLRRLVGPVLESDYVLTGASPGPGADVLYAGLRELSLYSGCSRRAQFGAALRCLFPGPKDVGHLPTQTTSSPLRYGAYLGRPQRITRGALAIGHLLTAVARYGSARDAAHLPDMPGLRAQ